MARIDMASLVAALSGEVRLDIVDQTGLTGFFDINVDLPPMQLDAVTGDPITGDAAGPSFFTVLRERLGLSLESSRGPVEMLVIDRIERPTDN